MDFSLEAIYGHKSTNTLFTIAIFFMAILLHQSQVIFGVNISFADIFCLAVFIVLLIKNQLIIPITQTLFFIVVLIFVLITAVYYIPSQFMYIPIPLQILSDFIKLIAIFVFFILGYNLSRVNLVEKVIKWYSLFGVLIGVIGILFTVFNIQFLSNIVFLDHTRFRGLMIDPNYFSILQITAFVYLSRVKTVNKKYTIITLCITALSVLISGSKTGIITLFGYLTIRIAEHMLKEKKQTLAVASNLIFIGLLIAVVPLLVNYLDIFVNFLGAKIPAFSRVQLLFTDPNSALSENGSSRTVTWKVALQLIHLSPVIGIGIGTYTNLAFDLFRVNHISHNTFLQLSSEWGIPLAFLFFTYVFLLIGRATLHGKSHIDNLIFRDIIIILLFGSIAISLNNARILWLVLGALVYSLEKSNTKVCLEEKHAKKNIHVYKKKEKNA